MALNDYLFSEEFLFEGEQAEEYKKRKNANISARNRKEYDRNQKRYQGGSRAPGDKAYIDFDSPDPRKALNKYRSQQEKDSNRRRKAGEMINRAEKERTKSGKSSLHTGTIGGKTGYDAEDAANRHMRRHPKQYKESAELYDGHIELI